MAEVVSSAESVEVRQQGIGQRILNFFDALRRNFGELKRAFVEGRVGKDAGSEAMGAILATIIVGIFVQLIRLARGKEPIRFFGGPTDRDVGIIPSLTDR